MPPNDADAAAAAASDDDDDDDDDDGVARHHGPHVHIVLASEPEAKFTEEPLVKRPPLWAWGALALAVAACSSGGVWFALMGDSPGIMRASWRLQFTFLLLLPGFVLDWRESDTVLRARWRGSLGKMAVAGLSLAVHFAAWSLSLNYTSLADSLLFVTTTPILLVAWQTGVFFAVRLFCHARTKDFEPPTALEVCGVLVGFGAATMLALGDTAHADSDTVQPSAGGDALALLGAAAIAVYLNIGAALRQFLPVWMYACPVTLFAAVFCGLLSLCVEQTDVTGNGPRSFFGDFDAYRVGLVVASAATAGILGHTLVNLSIKYISPLIVAIMLLLEPVVGSMFGYFAGVQDAPSAVVYCAGLPLMLSAALVISGARGQPLHRRLCSRALSPKSPVVVSADATPTQQV